MIMEIMIVLFKQIFLMFIYMMIGYVLYKKKLVTKQGSKELGSLLLYIILPMAIIKPYLIDFSREKLEALEITDWIDNTDLSVALEQIRSLLKKGR